jgi:hypothetical protein
MPADDYKPLLNDLMADTEVLMWTSSNSEGYFTNYEFIRRMTQKLH